MADTHETIADIIAELRERGECRERSPVVYDYADRLEAALKREMSKNMSKNGADFGQLGDAAKLREALKKCLLYIACAESVGIGTITLNDKVKLDPKKIIKSAKAALAAPPRNCDSYDSADEMMKEYADDAFLEEWKEWRETGKCNPLMLDALLCINWLFLTNEKGETNGNE